jgi:hypothetical protein
MDYLPIQAMSVPCGRIFSSAKETDIAKRNRISPFLVEIIQMLKFALKKERLDFTAGWTTLESDLMDVKPVNLGSLMGDDGNAFDYFDGVLNYLEEHGEN